MTIWQAMVAANGAWDAWDRAHPTITRLGAAAMVAIAIGGIVFSLRMPRTKARTWLVISFGMTVLNYGCTAVVGP